jgi:NADH:ubiquinone oxidoreductase subunit 4 (subunit M)
MVQRVFFGTCDNDENKELSDMNWREALIAFPIVIMIFWIGIYPRTFIDKIEPSVNKVIETVKSKAQTGDDSENATFESIDSDEIKPDEPGEEQWDSTGQ